MIGASGELPGPEGAISGGAGYITAGIIARDLEVPLWWEPMDARASLRRLASHG